MDNRLIGTWSADHMYGPGAQSDEVLVFNPDGTGRLEILNFGLSSADFFRWETVRPGYISLRGQRRLEFDMGGQPVVAAPDLEILDVPYQVQEERTPSGKAMPVLRVKLSTGISDHYGLVSQSPAPWQEEPDPKPEQPAV